MPQQPTTVPGRPAPRLRAALLWVLLGLTAACAAMVLHAHPAGGVHSSTGHTGQQATSAPAPPAELTPREPQAVHAPASGAWNPAAHHDPAGGTGGQDCAGCPGDGHVAVAVVCLLAAVVTLFLLARPRTVLRRTGWQVRAGPRAVVVHLVFPRPPDLAELCILRT